MGIQGLNLNVLGMQVSQASLRITNQNIANATTENYSKKLSLQSTIATQNVVFKKISTGVKIEDVTRAKNQFLDNQYRNTLTQKAFFEKLSNINSQLSNMLGAPSSQVLINNAENFYKAANNLSQDPNETNKKTFLNSAQGLSNAFNTVYKSINTIQDSINSKISGELRKTVDSLNVKLQKLSVAQRQINILRANELDVSSLEDSRDTLINDLHQYSNLSIRTNQAGDFYQVRTNLYSSPNEEAKIQGSIGFSSIDSPIIPAITAGNRQLDFSINDGNGSITNFMVNLPENASLREVVKSINEHFRAAGGLGSIAAIDASNKLVLGNHLIDNSIINSSNSISLNPTTASILTTLGLPAAPVTSNGSTGLGVILADVNGLKYNLDIEFGNDKVTDGVLATNIILKKDGIKQGLTEISGGSIGAQLTAINKSLPKIKEELSIIAMNIKDTVNGLLRAGTKADGTPGIDLFSGYDASNFTVASNMLNSPNSLALGEITNVGGISSGENNIIEKVSELFNDKGALISLDNTTQKLYLKANDTSYQISKLPVIPGLEFNVNVNGLITDGINTFNAGNNGIGANSLVQVQFLDSNQNPLGGAQNIQGAIPPNDSISWKGSVPAGASFISMKINDTSFNDNNASNNYGHFEVEFSNKTNNGILSTFKSAIIETTNNITTDGNEASQMKSTYSDIASAIKTQIESTRSVSMEEEAANLLVYQKAFAANSRAFSAINQSLEDVFTFIR